MFATQERVVEGSRCVGGQGGWVGDQSGVGGGDGFGLRGESTVGLEGPVCDNSPLPHDPQANRVFTALEPWKSETSDHNLISAIVFAHEALRLTGIALTPVMPGKMAVLLDNLSVPQDKRRWEDLIWDEEGALGRVVRAVSRSREGKGKKEVLFPPIVEEV
jgi:hypothetical protein